MCMVVSTAKRHVLRCSWGETFSKTTVTQQVREALSPVDVDVGFCRQDMGAPKCRGQSQQNNCRGTARLANKPPGDFSRPDAKRVEKQLV